MTHEKKSGEQPPRVQGEGDYEAARRYRRDVEEFVEENDTAELARAAQPQSPEEARALESAEAIGRSRARGRKRRAVGDGSSESSGTTKDRAGG
jgi:hypothetical protein